MVSDTLSKQDYEARVTKLYREGEMWYIRAATYFPWESRIYTQLAELYSQKNNIQSHVSAIFRSIIW
jgi:RNase P subunit RPR2